MSGQVNRLVDEVCRETVPVIARDKDYLYIPL